MNKKTYVLLDDDKWLGLAWKLSADQNGITFFHFNLTQSFWDFFSEQSDPSVYYFYIDLNLNNSDSGLDVLKKLLQSNCKNLYLATAMNNYPIADLPKGVLLADSNKLPPWEL